jgi:hypothetical protein
MYNIHKSGLLVVLFAVYIRYDTGKRHNCQGLKRLMQELFFKCQIWEYIGICNTFVTIFSSN